ncbi:MAG: tRNA (5-methylaminomethyl-2-thiouridine)(34)-methyltransferase MnmD [Flavobacteriales bacterium]|jgi:tRNA U34 5-methylaminomethyl-2-thiouridine-forming methyltransferase MnmC|nr:tRNA (5-methylaminomethyl-2-thiouridine)(34)-methyltransferase MnmD [Flavobacteriales bacterium]
MDGRELEMELVVSDDGSHTIRIPSLKEHYHSHKGAIQECAHVFIKMGLEQFPEDASLRIFEMGFGTGLNVLMTAINARSRSIYYKSIEAFPLDRDMISRLNYPAQIGTSEAIRLFGDIHDANWQLDVKLIENFVLHKQHTGLQELESETGFDLIYYDAFAPHAQPELWTMDVWNKLFEMMNPGGILVTYCAKGQVRRDLQSAGFDVERLPGPPGKREMLRAQKA